MPRSLVISLDRSLPPRATPLEPKALAKVFGGCNQANHNCHDAYMCCPGLTCQIISGYGVCRDPIG